MSIFSRRPVLRWLLPVVLAVVLAAGGSVAGLITADAGSRLSPRTASQLLVDVQQAKVTGLSGTVVQNADLGLPSIPGVSSSGGGAGGSSSDLSSLISGSHTLRLWYAGPNRVRVALLGSLGESDVVRNGTDLWTWSSKDKTATHRTVPKATDSARSMADSSAVTPQQAADAALKAISPTTKVTTAGTATVAGRAAYELVLQPRDTGSLVGSVRIAVDGKTHVPLRVQVFAKGADKPAFAVGFTSFDPSTPAASVFGFNPPPVTKVTESGSKTAPDAGSAHHATDGASAADKPTVVGKGWTSVVVAKLPTPTDKTGTSGTSGKGASGSQAQLAKVLAMLPKVSGSWGSGHLLRGTLFSALLTDDGRLAVGAVAPDALYAALGR